MKKEKPFIRRFVIKKLFGEFNVDIPFNSAINIFIGENGIGKTTILNCINHVLNINSVKLYEIDFEEIIVYFRDGKRINILHNELVNGKNIEMELKRWYRNDNSLNENSLVSNIKYHLRNYLKENELVYSEELQESYRLVEYISRRIEIDNDIYVPVRIIKKILEEIKDIEEKSWEDIMIEELKERDILYLPTYRRIEKDFEWFKDKDFIRREYSNLRFGMKDVNQLIDEMCKELITKTSEGFKEMTGNLLKDSMKLINNKYKFKSLEINNSNLDIVLERLTNEIGPEFKEEILYIIKSTDTDKTDFKYLYLILKNLITISNKTNKMDEYLVKFTTVCNQYLENKKFEYDPYKVICKLVRTDSGNEISLNNLSSGEKQIISLFANIYLSKDEKKIVLFDEPELSLSLFWQQRLIPDLVASEKCNFLIAITHSPFIFDNEYKFEARDIKQFIKNVKR